MNAHQEAVRNYLSRVVEQTGKDLTTIAREARVAPSTLTRFMNGKEVKHIISLRTLSKVSAASGIAVPTDVSHGPPDHSVTLQKGDKLDQLVHQQLRLLNRSWDALFDDERAALVSTAKAFIANRRKSA